MSEVATGVVASLVVARPASAARDRDSDDFIKPVGTMSRKCS